MSAGFEPPNATKGAARIFSDRSNGSASTNEWYNANALKVRHVRRLEVHVDDVQKIQLRDLRGGHKLGVF